MKKNFLLILICLFSLISCASQKPDNSEADLANEYADEARPEIDEPRYADMAKMRPWIMEKGQTYQMIQMII